MIIDDQVKDVILFRYLPSLWYTHPIPNNLREFWYTERVDILNFMKKNYTHLDIHFLPDRILKDISQNPQVTKPLTENFPDVTHLSTNLLCHVPTDNNQFLNFFVENQVDSIFEVMHKYIT